MTPKLINMENFLFCCVAAIEHMKPGQYMIKYWDDLQILLLILSEIKRINELQYPLKLSENLRLVTF